MKNNWLILGVVAVGAYLIYNRMSKPTDNGNGKEIAPPPVTFGKPPVNTSPNPRSLPAERGQSNKYLPNGCPTKETLARTRYSQAQMDKFRALGCLDN
jgi:hypothetical protein